MLPPKSNSAPLIAIQQSSFFAIICIGILILMLLANLLLGASNIDWPAFFRAFGSNPLSMTSDDVNYIIVMNLRLPRLITAAFCGASLACAGVVCQGLFRNDLASPSVLGTTAAATLAVVLVYYFNWHDGNILATPLAAFIGALLLTLLVVFILKKNQRFYAGDLLLTGFCFTTFFGAITSLVISLAMDDQMKVSAILHWILGSFSGRNFMQLGLACLPVALGLGLAVKLAPGLDILTLGDDVASTLSLNVKSTTLLGVVAISLLVAAATSLGGAIPFVGLIVPHLTRIFVGPAHKRLLFYCAINGASLMLTADLVARTIAAPREIEVGILTSLIGAPFFLWLLVRERRGTP